MLLLEMTKTGLEISPHVIGIKEFYKIWKRDRSEHKEKAIKDLSYVFYFCSFDSPYAKYPRGDREKEIVDDVYDNKWKPDSLIKEACAAYEKITQTTSSLLLQDAVGAIQKLRAYFQEVDLTEVDEKDKLRYSAKDLIANLKQVGDVVAGLKKLEEEVNKEQTTSGHIKGGGQAGIFED